MQGYPGALVIASFAWFVCAQAVKFSRNASAAFATHMPYACLQVKRCYMKANLVIHPDKVKQKGGTLEQVVTADIAFDILKVAWCVSAAAQPA